MPSELMSVSLNMPQINEFSNNIPSDELRLHRNVSSAVVCGVAVRQRLVCGVAVRQRLVCCVAVRQRLVCGVAVWQRLVVQSDPRVPQAPMSSA